MGIEKDLNGYEKGCLPQRPCITDFFLAIGVTVKLPESHISSFQCNILPRDVASS